MPQPLRKRFGSYEGLFSGGVFYSQLYLLAVALSVYAIQVVLVGHARLLSTLLDTFVAGNSIAVMLLPTGQFITPASWRSFFLYCISTVPA